MSPSYSRHAFRRSLLQYTSGRILNALAAFFSFVWIASHLPEQHYANYIAAYACLEILLVVSGFGMEWVTSVFIPQVKLHASGEALKRFIIQCTLFQALLLLLGAIAMAISAPFLADWLALKEASSAFQIYAIAMFIEGFGRVLRDQILSSLLLQGAAQVSQMARNIALPVAVFFLFSHESWRTTSVLAWIEVGASALSLLVAAIFLSRQLIQECTQPATNPAWIQPTWTQMLKAGRNAWLSNLANLSWGGQAAILLATRFLGADSTAALGFARNLSEQIRRYMPMEFLLGIVRTLLIARFAQDGSQQLLGTKVGLTYKANLLFLLPLLIVATIYGEELCAVLSHGRYGSAHWLLVGWLSVLLFWAHHRLTDLLAHTLGRSELTSQSSLRLLVVPPLLAVAASFCNWPLLFLVLAGAELIYSFMVLRHLEAYRVDWIGLAKLGLISLLTGCVLALLPAANTPIHLGIMTAIAYLLIFACAVFVQVWSPAEAAVLPQLASLRNRWLCRV